MCICIFFYSRLLTDGSKNDEEDESNHGMENGNELRYVPDEGFSTVSVVKHDISGKRKRNVVDEDPLMSADQFLESYAKKRPNDFVVGDADEQFLLSCLPALRRLPPKENAIARMRIQQVLFDIEFGGCDQSDTVVTKEEVID